MNSKLLLHLLAASVVLSSTSPAAPGDLYEADFTGGFIYKFDPSGGRTVFASGLSGPEGMAFDGAGNLLVTETGTGTIYKYTPDGSRTTFASGLNGPASLVFGGSGNLYDAEFFGGIIYKFTPAGARTTFATGLSGPANLLFDTAGNLFEADFHSGTIFKSHSGRSSDAFRHRSWKSTRPRLRYQWQSVRRGFPGRHHPSIHPSGCADDICLGLERASRPRLRSGRQPLRG